MPGKPIKELCPICGASDGKYHDWFPELGAWEEWLCGTQRGIARLSEQRIVITSEICRTIRDLKTRVSELESRLLTVTGK